jgi:hypothetical protein
MNRAELRAPVLDQGIRHTNFFNGRLLFAEDLLNEAEANRAQHAQLGRGIGDGIVHGLDVWIQIPGAQGATPVLKVTAGLALNRRGQALELPRDTELALLREEERAISDAGLFATCLPPAGVAVPPPTGAYVLIMSPVSAFSAEQAPMSGLGAEGGISGCGSRFAVEGVQFRLETLHTSGTTGPAGAAGAELDSLVAASSQPSKASQFRNLLAHLCFGTAETVARSADPAGALAATDEPGLIGTLRRSKVISDCDVPLAVVHWTTAGVNYVDVWAVRRTADVARWSGLFSFLSERRLATAHAVLQQFQQHLTDLPRVVGSPPLSARSFFRYLPPVGVLPLQNNRYPAGFLQSTFFDGLAFGPPRQIAAAQVRPLLVESLGHDPIDLSLNPRVQLYVIAENTAAQTLTAPPQPVVIFATTHARYASEQPRFPDLCQALKDAAAAYAAVLTKNVFFPNETDPRVVAARTALNYATRDAQNVARHYSTFACAGWPLQVAAGLDALRDLYGAQKRFVGLLQANWPGVNDPTLIRELGEALLPPLETSASSLNAALTASNLPQAVAAQNRVTAVVRTAGEDSTVGQISVQYVRSSRGRTIVVSDTTNPFNFTFRVTNVTNRTLEILLSASFAPPKHEWSSSIRIRDAAGNEIRSITLDNFDEANPTNPNAFREVQASIMTPAGATAPDTARLLFVAEAPAPAAISDTEPLDLKLGTAEEPEVPVVEIRPPVVQGNPANARELDDITFAFPTIFRTPTTPLNRDFRAIVTLSADAAFFDVFFVDKTLESQTPTERRSAPFTMQNGATTPVTIRVTPNDSSVGRRLTATLRLESTTGSIQAARTFAVRVTTANP